MPLWKRLWLLFSAIWVAVAGLNVFAILAFGDNPLQAVLWPAALGVGVPLAAYALLALLARHRKG